ncbi:hypothetical protein OG21DRAFT_467050 [Imleria badia]|nr:hypothetical protein OG21DRAFT_467050 [Imleria badia]
MRLFASLARHHVHRQDDLVRRDPGEINIYKRFDGCRFTFFAVGLGSCGVVSQPSDFMVALNSAQYNGGSYCFQMITITVNGKTTQAQVLDECPGCPYGGLDFSQGLFEFFADISVGVLTGSWDFGSGSPPPPSPSPPPPPPPPSPTISVDIPATSWLPSPTTTSQPPPSTTTSAPSTTSSSSSNSTVSSSTSSLAPTQTTTYAVAETAGTVPGADSSVLLDLNLSIVYIGQFLGALSGL